MKIENGQPKTFGVMSRGIAESIPSLEPLLAPDVQLAVFDDASSLSILNGIAGWGRKATAECARREAEARGLPYLALEDGFLRSLGLGVDGAARLSIIADSIGIYYDATRPSALEEALEKGGWETTELLARAAAGMSFLQRERLSKYNCQPDLSRPDLADAKVLVVDQTVGDASVALGMADATAFTAMLQAAKAENPGKRIIVKTHPDVIAGKKKGYLTEAARASRQVVLVAEAVNPWSLLEKVEAVYTVTSQLGFEALMAGKRVHCFGMPFYAGWGVTEDRLTCPRRTRHRSLDEIFAAAYLMYPRYLDPFTGKRCEFEQTAGILASLKRANESNRGVTICLGMSAWKRETVARFLSSTDGPPRFHRYAWTALKQARRHKGRLVVWSSKSYPGLEDACRRDGIPLLRMEDGFLRSVGLGANFIPASSLVLDGRGIYYDPATPSDLEHLLATTDFTPEIIARAQHLRHEIVSRGIDKYNVGKTATSLALPSGRMSILVPGQVEEDASVRRGSPEVRSNLALLAAVRTHCPDAFIIFKPHPDVEAGFRVGALNDEVALQHADLVVRDVNSSALSLMVDEVHTMTSLVGFEALLRGKKVVCYGLPFYAGWGLTTDRIPLARRARCLTLDELVAATLILYPRYVDPVTGFPCGPEVILERLTIGRADFKPLARRGSRLMGSLRALVSRCCKLRR